MFRPLAFTLDLRLANERGMCRNRKRSQRRFDNRTQHFDCMRAWFFVIRRAFISVKFACRRSIKIYERSS